MGRKHVNVGWVYIKVAPYTGEISMKFKISGTRTNFFFQKQARKMEFWQNFTPYTAPRRPLGKYRKSRFAKTRGAIQSYMTWHVKIRD